MNLQLSRKDAPKALIVAAHPDDEYAFAATVCRITHELAGVVDQAVLTNGEGGYRYSQLAEAVYGEPLTVENVGRRPLAQRAAAAVPGTEGRAIHTRREWSLPRTLGHGQPFAARRPYRPNP